jgi:hypothetical protein
MNTATHAQGGTTMQPANYYDNAKRLKALKRFSFTTTIISLLGHGVLGFEQSYATPFVGVLAACGTQLVLDTVRAWQEGKTPGYAKGKDGFLSAMLPAYIVGLTCAMFLYNGERFSPIVFACVLSIASKFLFQAKIDGLTRHFMNPSNFGILLTLVLMPAVSIILPYGFSSQVGDWAKVGLPAVLFGLGAFLNGTVTQKLPLVAGWLGSFVVQAVARWLLLDQNILAMLAPATGVVAVLFTFFMVTDPGTTPEKPLPQLAFGAGVGLLYGVLISAHVVFALFWALFAVCAARGLYCLVTGGRATGRASGEDGRGAEVISMPRRDAPERAAG